MLPVALALLMGEVGGVVWRLREIVGCGLFPGEAACTDRGIRRSLSSRGHDDHDRLRVGVQLAGELVVTFASTANTSAGARAGERRCSVARVRAGLLPFGAATAR